jgi:starch synthase
VNGIDVEEWDPARDRALGDHRYAPEEPPDRVLAKKRAVRAALRAWTVPADRAHRRAGEQPYARVADDSMLIGVVTRIDYQKCPVLLAALDSLCRIHAVQIAVLGNANPNDPLGQRYEARLRAAQSERLLFFDGFDIPLSHLIYGASETFLVPSVYEPCGLTQLVAMRYGSVPIARGVGGLVDTVVDEADASRAAAANGFRFKEVVDPSRMVDEGTAAGLLVATVERALAVRATPRWRELVRNGMARDSSWTVPAAQYAKLYDDAMRRAVADAFFA